VVGLQSRVFRRLMPYTPAICAAAAGLVLSVAAARTVSEDERQHFREGIEYRGGNLAAAHCACVTAHLELFGFLRELFRASDHVNRDEFRLFVEASLDSYHGFHSVQWVPRVDAGERDGFEQSIRAEGFEDFCVHPACESGDQFPINFIVPGSAGDGRRGRDCAADPVFRAAMTRARDSGQPAATRPVEVGGAIGFVVFQAIYRNGTPVETKGRRCENLAGFVAAEFRVADLVCAALEGFELKHLGLQIVDETDAAGPVVIHESGRDVEFVAADLGSATPRVDEPFFVTTLPIAGRQWRLSCFPSTATMGKTRAFTAARTLACGVGMTVLLSVYLASLAGRSARITALVKERTGELSRANAKLEVEIAGRKRVEGAREKLLALVTESNRELEALNERLQRSNRELQDFASVASHDLQEPLRKVMAFGERLKTRCHHALPDEGRDYVERMNNAAGRMRTLIDDLLTFSRVITKAQPFEPIDLMAVAREVVCDLEARIEELQANVDISGLPAIEADPLQMRQLFQNLIGNALKFHRDGEAPVVTVRGEALSDGNAAANGGVHDAQRCRLVIADNGIGFAPEHAQRIFGMFQRLHGRGRYEGSGVGLTICQRIVERHGGTITAGGEPGRGATFTVVLPIRQHTSEGPRAWLAVQARSRS